MNTEPEPRDDDEDDAPIEVPVDPTGPDEEPVPEGYKPPAADRVYTRAGDRPDTDDETDEE